MTKLPLAERVGMETVKAPEPPVCVEIIVLPSVSWFDAADKVKLLRFRPANEGVEVVSKGWSIG